MSDSIVFDYPFAGTILTVNVTYQNESGPLGQHEVEIVDSEILYPDGTEFEGDAIFIRTYLKTELIPVTEDIMNDAYGRL